MDYFKIILFLLLVFFVIFNKENFVNPSLGDISMIEYQMPVNQFMIMMEDQILIKYTICIMKSMLK